MRGWDADAFDRWLTTDPANQPETIDEYDPYDPECAHAPLACNQPDLCPCGCVECAEARSDMGM